MTSSTYAPPPVLDASFPLDLEQPFTTATAHAAGLTANQLTALCRGGLLRRPLRGVYLAAGAGDSISLRAACLKLVVPPGSVICDRHAGWLHGAEMVLAPNEHLELAPVTMFRLAGNGRLRNSLAASGERSLLPRELVEVEGLLLTTPMRTAYDLGRLLHRDRAIAALDSMLRLGVFTLEELEAGVEQFRGMRGVRQLRALVPLADARAESPGESVLRLRWIDTGLPAPTPQYPVLRHGRTAAWLDLGLDVPQFGAEYDGAEWHSSPAQRRRDSHRRRWLECEAGWVLRVLRSTDMFGQQQRAHEMLREGYEEARRRTDNRWVG